MNYFNTRELDDDQWIEILKKNNKPTTQTFTEDRTDDSNIGAELDFRLTTPASPPPITNGNDWAYFITLAFPTNHKFKIKHVELRAQNQTRIVFSPIKYGDCTQGEQYSWLMYILTKYIKMVSDEYDLFFEQTKEGNLHIHGRLRYYDKKKTKKDVRALFHRMFECPTQYKHFIDIKDYNPDKWTNYDIKETKTYQTLDYPHLKNI